MIDAVYINASLTIEDAKKKRLTHKNPDEFGLFLVHYDADNQLYAVLPKRALKVICDEPEREWVGMTFDEFAKLMPYCHNEFDLQDFQTFAAAIEAKLKEKNHDYSFEKNMV
jgi:ABC-type transporter lipoprotein component MlaA